MRINHEAGHGAKAVCDAILRGNVHLPRHRRRSLCWDQGAEVARHPERHRFWPALPKRPDAVAVASNWLPRKTLGWRTPAEALDAVHKNAKTEHVATTG